MLKDIRLGISWTRKKTSKGDEVNIIDQDGYQLVKGSRRLGHFMPDIIAVDADVMKDSFAGGSLKPKSLRPKPSEPKTEGPSKPKSWVPKSL